MAKKNKRVVPVEMDELRLKSKMYQFKIDFEKLYNGSDLSKQIMNQIIKEVQIERQNKDREKDWDDLLSGNIDINDCFIFNTTLTDIDETTPQFDLDIDINDGIIK
jgi:hypothetical protein